jgi:hypothetical protein
VQFGGGDWSPVILHWDGSAWTRFDGPNPGSRAGLSGVNAISADDAWAVGSYVSSVGQLTLIEHWDGIRWSQVSSPSPGQYENWLTGVSAVSGRLAWAVGGSVVRHRSGPRRTRTLIERWDGHSWSQVASPNPGGRQDTLSGVAATSSRHAWAVGAFRGEGKGRQTLVARWNGSTWTQVWSPNPGPTENHLYSVSAVSPTDVWAVGDYVATRGTGPSHTLIAHLGDSGWTQVPSPDTGGTLTSVSADSATDAWASGFVTGFFLRWNGMRWSRWKNP